MFFLLVFLFFLINLLGNNNTASVTQASRRTSWERFKANGWHNRNDHYRSILHYFDASSSRLDAIKAHYSRSRGINLPADYNKLEVPKLKNVKLNGIYAPFDHEEFKSDVLPVEVDVTVRKIRNLNQIDEAITVELDISEKWLDYVILLKNKENWDQNSGFHDDEVFTKSIRSLDPVFLKRIWKPDLFIEDAFLIERPGIITSPVRLLFSPSGFIVFSTRITVKLNCAMEFKYYPADTQTCRFKIRSYSYTTSDLNITWGRPGPFFLDRSDDNFYLKLDMLDTVDVIESEGTVHENYQETYRILQFNICARRQLSYHLMQTYLPSIFFIFITWLSFLVPVTMVEARIGISMTTLLTLTSMFAAVRESTPTLNYIKAIDIWMVVCIFFVFLTLLELTILACRRHLRTIRLSSGHGIAYSELNTEKNLDFSLNPMNKDQRNSRLRRDSRNPALNSQERAEDLNDQKIENFAFLGFLVLFIIFNLIYWPWLLLSSEYLHWELDYTYNSRRI